MGLSGSFVAFLLVACYLAARLQSQDTVGGRPVLVANTKNVNWFSARESCMSFKMTLLEIYNAAENEDAYNLLAKYHLKNAWIGGNDLVEQDEYRWMNGTVISEMFWSPAASDLKGQYQDCITITSDSRHPTNWIDRECENTYAYICQPYCSSSNMVNYRIVNPS